LRLTCADVDRERLLSHVARRQLRQNLSRKGDQMIRGLMLLMLAAALFQACADTNSHSRNRNTIIDLANTCATCGGSISDGYFAGSAFKAVGPGNY
jgi:hypothetical protein